MAFAPNCHLLQINATVEGAIKLLLNKGRVGGKDNKNNLKTIAQLAEKDLQNFFGREVFLLISLEGPKFKEFES